jgi:RNA polymerase sigma factor (sigma-70 family)
MPKKTKASAASFSVATDEELLNAYRHHDQRGKDELDRRYCTDRKIWRRIMPDLAAYYSQPDINLACFVTYIDCVEHFRFGRGAFSGYYRMALSRKLMKMRAGLWSKGFQPLSLNAPVSKDVGEGGLTFSDIQPADESEDPKSFVEALESNEGSWSYIKGLPEIEREILALRIQGTTYKEIARRLSITPKAVLYHLRKIERRVEQINKLKRR